MAQEIVMPRLSDSMEEGTILKWMKSVGDDVAVGEELVEIETDKANMVFEADAGGTLVEIVAGEGDTLPIGEVIARVGDPSEAPSGNGAQTKQPETAGEEKAEDAVGGSSAVPASHPSRVHAAKAPTAASPSSSPTQPSPPSGEPADGAGSPAAEPSREVAAPGGDGRVKASPIARRIAQEKGVDLASLHGSGPGGRIIKADVEKAEAAPTPAPAAAREEALEVAAPAATAAGPTPGVREKPETAKGTVETVELTKLQQTVSRRMAESKATVPHFQLQTEIDMSRCWTARAELKATAREGDVVPSFNDMVVKAAAIALREFPRANGSYRDGRWELYSRVNVGVAVAARDALVVPTVFDADRKGLRQIAAETRALAARVREGSITPPELSGGTFAVSNLGMYGVTNFQAVINPPHAAILAVGAITERPAIHQGEVTAARMMGVTLACDHRILYGADGAEFLARIRALLEEPLGLAL